ncbi:MAG TPA: RluA family pseudouridine synthase [Syntrophorhabdaceae bacterium]|nr:RluA family pseudouridine synthase [Syntrophorhabdaceae bacterium]
MEDMIDLSHIVIDSTDKRLDIYLAEMFSIARTKIKYAIDSGHITVDGKTVKPSFKVKKGMTIKGGLPEEEPLTLEPQEISFHILYEDEFIMAINKPAGMVVHPSFGHREGTLVNAILGYMKGKGKIKDFHVLLNLNQINSRPFIVHRLDKGTTGVILVAKDTKTQEMLSNLFKDRRLTKVYRAITEGTIGNDSLVIDGNIGRHPIERKKMAVLKIGGREALTTIKVLKRLKDYTYIEAYPKTGRTHQIRVHLAHIGNPIVGDEIYGKRSRHATARPMLHAFRIEFVHPVTGRDINIEAPVPDDMLTFLELHGD